MSVRLLRLFSAALSVLLIVLAAAVAHAQKSGPAGLPKALTEAFKGRYPHWSLADVVKPATATCAAAAPAATAVFKGDFDGDGRDDLAVQIHAGDATRVVVAFTRVETPQLLEIDAPVGLFVVHRRGERFVSPELNTEGYYSADTLGTDVCGDGVVWYWTGAAFKKMAVKHPSQPVVKAPLHSTGAASRLPALLLPQIHAVFSVVAPGQPGAAPVSVRRGTFTTGC
jgi:hypothetical protein